VTEVRGFITNRRHYLDAILGATRLAPMDRMLCGCQAGDDGDGSERGRWLGYNHYPRQPNIRVLEGARYKLQSSS